MFIYSSKILYSTLLADTIRLSIKLVDQKRFERPTPIFGAKSKI